MKMLSWSSVGQVELQRGRRNHGGDSTEMLCGRADMEVGSQWTGKLFGKEPAESSPVDATNDLTDEMAVVDRVIARRRTRGPPRLLGSEASGGRLEVVDVLQFDRALPTGHPGRV